MALDQHRIGSPIPLAAVRRMAAGGLALESEPPLLLLTGGLSSGARQHLHCFHCTSLSHRHLSPGDLLLCRQSVPRGWPRDSTTTTCMHSPHDCPHLDPASIWKAYSAQPITTRPHQETLQRSTCSTWPLGACIARSVPASACLFLIHHIAAPISLSRRWRSIVPPKPVATHTANQRSSVRSADLISSSTCCLKDALSSASSLLQLVSAILRLISL